MDVTAAVIEVASATRKPMRVIVSSRSQVTGALLTLPELKGDKLQAARIAQVVWDMQGKVEVRQPAVRAQFVEVMVRPVSTARGVEVPEIRVPEGASTSQSGGSFEGTSISGEEVNSPLFARPI